MPFPIGIGSTHRSIRRRRHYLLTQKIVGKNKMQSAFLRDFIQMRQALGAKQVKHVTTSAPDPEKVSLRTIVEDKPALSVVKKYFERRVAELEEEEE